MSKFDAVRKKVKRRTNKLHLFYVFLFVVFISISTIFIINQQNHTKELENILEDYQSKTERLGESLLTTLQQKKEYEEYFDSLPFGKPLDSIIINSYYGWRFHPVDSCYKFHTGIDLQALINTPIYASGSGKIIYCGWKQGYGKIIIIEHPFKNKSLYAHLNKFLVDSGQYVHKGDTIALSGRTGKVSGPHLHYEIRLNEKYINPFDFLKLDTNNFLY